MFVGNAGPCFVRSKRAFHQIKKQKLGGETYETNLSSIDHANRVSIKENKEKKKGRESNHEHVATYGDTPRHMAVLL